MLNEDLVRIRRHIHQHPETAHEEFQTTEYIRERLLEHEIRIVDYGLPTGVIAEIGGFVPGPILAMRADIDALPVQEKTGLPYASKITGKMHACGHDFHTAVVIGAGVLLKQIETALPGTVRLIFQPAEETATGATMLLEHGVFDDVTCIFGLHNKPDLPVGTIGVRSGALMAAADGFVVEIKGKGSHAAVPDDSIDPIVTASSVIGALQSIVSRNLSALDSGVVSVTKLQSGTTWNIIPESAVLEGTIRTFDPEVRQNVLRRFEEIVTGVSTAFGASAEIRWVKGPPPINNHEGLTEVVRDAAKTAGLRVVKPKPSPAGEDFAFYQQRIPGVFVFVGTAGHYEWHHPKFDLDEKALPAAAEFCKELCRLALAQTPFLDVLEFYGEAEDDGTFGDP